MAKIKLNGKEVEVDGKEKLLKVCLDQGAFVPHYCWHPGLQPAGNCRMCLVKVSNSRKLEVSCMYPIAENMEVTTEGPEVEQGRKAVLEYMLINHPLDCPICDKAGECDLQDYTYRYRGGVSRFDEAKEIKHTKDLGPNIRIWGNRCIVCTRCVRFCEEVAGTGELCVVNRGDHSVVDVFPGVPVDNPLSLNVVDICPVGALIDKNFMYQARVWFTKKTSSVCASCSRGCNIEITTQDNDIKRLVPRPNAEVNQHWICDEGRLNYRYVASERRLVRATGRAREIAEAGKKLKLAGIISSYQTIEEMHLFRKLMDALGVTQVALLGQSRGDRQRFPGGFVIEADKTPNSAYAARVFGPARGGAAYPQIVSGLQAGTIQGLVVMNGIPDFPMPQDLVLAARKSQFLAVSDILENALAEFAHVVLPGTAWAEKEGTFMNVDGLIQRVRKAVEPPVEARPEIEWLQDVLQELGERSAPLSAEGVFREAMPGMDYSKVGTLGAKANGQPSA